MVWVRPFAGNLRRDILTPLCEAKPELAAMTESRSVRIIGPLPLDYAWPRRLLHVRRIESAARFAGWRALILRSERPVAVVDCGIGPTGHPFHAIRGEPAARELCAALIKMRSVARQDGWRCADHEIRIVYIPQLELSAIWKRGRPCRVVPVGAGSSSTHRRSPVLGEWRALIRRHQKKCSCAAFRRSVAD